MRRIALPALLAAAVMLVPLSRAAGPFADYAFSVQPGGGMLLTGYEVGQSGDRNRVFELFTAAAFGAETQSTVGTVFRAEGPSARLEVHQNPHGTILLESFTANQVQWDLAADVGAIARGRWAEVGDERTTGAIVLLGAGDLQKSGESVTAMLASGEMAVFRASVGGDGLGAFLADGTLAADVFIGPEIDAVSYTGVAVEARRDGGVATVTATGIRPGQLLSVTLPRADLDPARMAVDGSGRLVQRSSLQELQSSGSGYVVFTSADAVEVVVLDTAGAYHIGPLGPSLEAYVGVGLAAITFVAAAVFLRRRQR